jgi:hypothetical protein
MIGAVTRQAIDASNAKAYRDAEPGPGSAPEPGQIPAEDFTRPYITAGHGADSPGNEDMSRVALSWRAGVAGEGPVAAQARNWRPAMLAVPSYGGEATP